MTAGHTASVRSDTESATGEGATPERAVIQIAGLTAVVECYAWEDDPDQRGRKRLWVLGLVGTRQGLEAIWANLIQGREAVIAPRPLSIGCPLDGPLGRAAFPTLSRRRKTPAKDQRRPFD